MPAALSKDTDHSTVQSIVLAFLKSRLHYNQPLFHAQDLRNYVSSWDVRIAPGSADRILRKVRREGAASYKLVSRSRSLYRAESVSA